MKKTLLILSAILLFTSCDGPHSRNYVRASNASAAEVYLKVIYTQVGFYYGKTGEVPVSLDDMRDEGVLDLVAKAEIDWFFDISAIELSHSGFVGRITATSTAEMGGGEGQVVEYDIETATFCGYGHDECKW